MPIFTVVANFTPGAAVNVGLEIAAVAGHPITLLDLEVSQEASTTSAAFGVTVGYSTAAATGWTTSSLTPKDVNDVNNATANTTAKAYSSGTSTDGTGATVRWRSGLNALGLPYLKMPKEKAQPSVATAHFLFVKFAVAPPASTAFNIVATFEEF